MSLSFAALSGGGALAVGSAQAFENAAEAVAQPAPRAVVWAEDGVCGQVLALSVDDAGQVFAALTGRAFGRGTVLLTGERELLREDRGLRSVEERVRRAQAWLSGGRLENPLRERQGFYSDPGDGAGNFLTKFEESVRRLEDADHDGRAESAVPLADGFNDPADGTGGALLALPGGRSWLYGCPPRLWRLEKREGAGPPIRKTVLAEGFGLRNGDGESGLHALLEAPDGWIYFGMGDRGFRIKTSGGDPAVGLGSGGIFRCRADGSELELFARGLRNPTGLAMDAEGHLFAVDQAAPGGKTRLLLVIPGADFGWQAEAVTEPGKGRWFEESMENLTLSPGPEQPLWCLPALARLEDLQASGLEALSGTAAAAGKVELLAADRSPGGKGGMVRLALEPAGAAFRLSGMADVWRGGAVLATAAAPDGSLFFADWGADPGVFSACRLRRLEWPGNVAPGNIPALIETLPGLPPRELRKLLESPSPRLRLRAGQALAARPFQDSMESLLLVARRSGSLPARIQALWSAGSLARKEPALLNELTRFLSDPEPSVRAAAASVLGEGRLRETPPALRVALNDAALPVRLAAAAALGRLRLPGAAEDLLAAAGKNEPGDPFVRSSLAAALAAVVTSPEALAEAGKTADVRETRLMVVHALRRQGAAELRDFLNDRDPLVAAEAARAVYDLPVFPALPALAAMLDAERAPGLPGPLLRRALLAAQRGGLAEDAGRIADFALAAECPAVWKTAALEILSGWDAPRETDPLWGRDFLPMPRLPGLAAEALRRAAEGLSGDADPAVSSAARAALSKPGPLPSGAGALLSLAQNAESPEDVRLAALRNLLARNALTPEAAHALALSTTAPPRLRAEARSFLMRRDPKSAPSLAAEAFNAAGSVQEKQAAIRTLDHLPGNANDNERLLLDAARRLSQGSVEPAVQVEVLEALQRRDIESRSPWRRATDAWLASLPIDRDPLSAWDMTLADGDPVAGRLVFETNAEAHCTACHSLGGQGEFKAPELDGVGTRLTPRKILESLVQPGARLAAGWESSAVPDPLEGSKTTSPMPPMGAVLSRREMRDLIAFLSGLKEK